VRQAAVARKTKYQRFFRHKVAERVAEIRAQQAADAAVEWLSYPEAVRAVLPVLFGDDWVGLATEQERVVLSIGVAHPEWRRYALIDTQREKQIARAERWLLINGVLEHDRLGVYRIRAARLHAALAGEASAAGRAGLAYRTGLQGKPTSWQLIEAECRRRYAAGERHPGNLGESRAEWARELVQWLRIAHPLAPAVTVKTLTNRLGPLLRELQSAG
jgi:hypothetical protein